MRISDWSSDVCSSDLEKQAKAQFERERDQQRANDAALSSRENRIALAGILFAIGALGAGAGLLFHSQRKPRNAKIAGGGGAALILVAAILFLTRPDAHADIAAPTDAAKPASAATAPIGRAHV